MARIRAPIVARYEALGSPETYARPPKAPATDVEISPVGLVFHKLGSHFPELGAHIFAPEVLGVTRELLGAGMYLEYASAVVVSGRRPFFDWHAHMGGVDNIRHRKEGIFPRYERPERITALLYLEDVSPEDGALRIRPRALTDPTEPPFDPKATDWAGQRELFCTAGTVVLLDQATWHAATEKRSAGLRIFIAFYLTAAWAPRPSWVDESFRAAAEADEVLASLLPGS